jgi:hypothetical protein
MSTIHPTADRHFVGPYGVFLAEQIAELDRCIAEQIRRACLEREQQLLQTVPGVKQDAAACMLGELDMMVFRDAKHCSSWSGVAPGNNITGGKRKRAPTSLRGNPWTRSLVTECAWSASRKKDSEFQQQYDRLEPHLGHKEPLWQLLIRCSLPFLRSYKRGNRTPNLQLILCLTAKSGKADSPPYAQAQNAPQALRKSYKNLR